jgi:hypothetical protein
MDSSSLTAQNILALQSQKDIITSVALTNINVAKKKYFTGKVFVCLHCSEYSVHFTMHAVLCHVTANHKPLIRRKASNKKVIENCDELYIDFSSYMDKDHLDSLFELSKVNKHSVHTTVPSIINRTHCVYELISQEKQLTFAIFNDTYMHKQCFNGEVFTCLHCPLFKSVHFSEHSAMCHVNISHKQLVRRKLTNKKIVENYDELYMNFTPHIDKELWQMVNDTYLQNKCIILPSDFIDYEQEEDPMDCLHDAVLANYINTTEIRVTNELQYHPDFVQYHEIPSTTESSTATPLLEEQQDTVISFTPTSQPTTDVLHIVTPESVRIPEETFHTPTVACVAAFERNSVMRERMNDAKQMTARQRYLAVPFTRRRSVQNTEQVVVAKKRVRSSWDDEVMTITYHDDVRTINDMLTENLCDTYA